MAHNKPNHRATWALNGEQGWTVGPAPDHYRCITCYFPRTRAERQCDTITYFPTVITYPKVNIEDHLRQAATDIVRILTKPSISAAPTLQQGDPTRNALLELATILQRADKLPSLQVIEHDKPLPRVKIPTEDSTESDDAALPMVGNPHEKMIKSIENVGKSQDKTRQKTLQSSKIHKKNKQFRIEYPSQITSEISNINNRDIIYDHHVKVIAIKQHNTWRHNIFLERSTIYVTFLTKKAINKV